MSVRCVFPSVRPSVCTGDATPPMRPTPPTAPHHRDSSTPQHLTYSTAMTEGMNDGLTDVSQSADLSSAQTKQAHIARLRALLTDTHTHTHTRIYGMRIDAYNSFFPAACLPGCSSALPVCALYKTRLPSTARSGSLSIGRLCLSTAAAMERTTQHTAAQCNAGQDWKETRASHRSRGQKDGRPAGRLRGRVEGERRQARVNACLGLHLASSCRPAVCLSVCLPVCVCASTERMRV